MIFVFLVVSHETLRLERMYTLPLMSFSKFTLRKAACRQSHVQA